MPTPISVAGSLEKHKLFSSVSVLTLVKFQVYDASTNTFPETFYLCNDAKDFDFNGQTYVAYPLNVEFQQEGDTEPNASLNIMDAQSLISSKMFNYQGAIGSLIDIMLIRSDVIVGKPEVLLEYKVLDASTSDYMISFNLGSRHHLSIEVPSRKQHKDQCSWKYKSLDCGYVGGLTSCDYTLTGPNGCEVHSNEVNYGGFPSLNQ